MHSIALQGVGNIEPGEDLGETDDDFDTSSQDSLTLSLEKGLLTLFLCLSS